MITVAEMKEWLDTLPQDAIVEILSHSQGTGYYDQGGWCTTKNFDPKEKPSWCHEDYPCFSHWELYQINGVKMLTIGEMQ